MENEIIIYKGNAFTLPVTVTDEDGLAFNLTGYTMKMSVKENYADTDANAKIGPLTATVTTPTSGIGTFTITTAHTANLENRSYVYDVELVKSETVGEVTTITERLTVLVDKFIVKNNVTRA